MRRSKSNPAKYTRNYKKISQRHMTGYGIDNKNGKSTSKSEEDVEQKRLEEILKQSELTWKRGLAENGHSISNNDSGGEDTAEKKKRSTSTTTQASEDNKEEKDNDMLSLLSPELQAQFVGMSGGNLLILPSKKKKTKKKQLPPLTPAEIKAAKSLYKNTQRKLQQLAQRKLQKEQRSTLYKQLESNKVSDSNRSLLLKSSELGKKITKKEYLKQLHKKELMGIKLTNDEMDVLYDTHDAPPNSATTDEFNNMKTAVGNGTDTHGGDVDAKELVGIKAVLESKKKSKKKKKKKRKSSETNGEQQDDNDVDVEKSEEKQVVTKKARLDTVDAEKKKVDSSATSSTKNEEQEDTPAVSSTPTTTDNTETSTTTTPIDYSSMMLASISSLKTKTDTSNEQIATEKLKKHKQQQEEIAKLEEEERKKRKVYVPTETVTVSSTVLGLGGDQSTASSFAKNSKSKLKKDTRVVQTINRPQEVQESRYNLPVSTMEYEIIDAIRSNDCTILCGETGSGKSTQVPQFLYEAGFSQRHQQQGVNSESTLSSANKEDGHLLIGITQPRRVAAVSTAKRVAYEMGCGSGQSIPPNNLISYQTRYETAGLGTSTQIKFMTDGILLQEIQSDLLLRKYGAIIIDEESTALVLFFII